MRGPSSAALTSRPRQCGPSVRHPRNNRPPSDACTQMKVILVGAGAFGVKHLEAMSKIDGVEVLSLVSRDPVTTADVAKKWKIPHCTTDLAQALAQPGVEAALLCSPTQLHAQQALQCLAAGKHVMIEIPIADS